jgi:hypothetical protein
MTTWFTIVLIFTPIIVIQFVKPYEVHCDPKIDRTNSLPVWCNDSLPNVYGFIQFVYWDNRFLAFVYR